MRALSLGLLISACGGAPVPVATEPSALQAPDAPEPVAGRSCDRVDVAEEYTQTFHFEQGLLVDVVTVSDRGGTTAVDRFERDALGRIVRTESRDEEMNGELHVCTHAWEAIEGGWLERRDCPTLDRETLHAHRYDAEGRRIHYAPEGGPTMEARCVYEDGRLAVIERSGVRSRVERDASGRIVALRFHDVDGHSESTTFVRSRGRIEVQVVIDDQEEPVLVIFRGDCEDLIVPECAAALAPPPPVRSD